MTNKALIEEAYSAYFGQQPPPYFFIPKTVTQAYTAGWQLERLQQHLHNKGKDKLVESLESLRVNIMLMIGHVH